MAISARKKAPVKKAGVSVRQTKTKFRQVRDEFVDVQYTDFCDEQREEIIEALGYYLPEFSTKHTVSADLFEERNGKLKFVDLGYLSATGVSNTSAVYDLIGFLDESNIALLTNGNTSYLANRLQLGRDANRLSRSLLIGGLHFNVNQRFSENCFLLREEDYNVLVISLEDSYIAITNAQTILPGAKSFVSNVKLVSLLLRARRLAPKERDRITTAWLENISLSLEERIEATRKEIRRFTNSITRSKAELGFLMTTANIVHKGLRQLASSIQEDLSALGYKDITFVDEGIVATTAPLYADFGEHDTSEKQLYLGEFRVLIALNGSVVIRNLASYKPNVVHPYFNDDEECVGNFEDVYQNALASLNYSVIGQTILACLTHFPKGKAYAFTFYGVPKETFEVDRWIYMLGASASISDSVLSSLVLPSEKDEETKPRIGRKRVKAPPLPVVDDEDDEEEDEEEDEG